MERGRPIWANSRREEVNLKSEREAGDATFCPFNVLLFPWSQAETAWRCVSESLRNVKRISLLSIVTGILYACLVIPGFRADTSVGLGTASSKARRVWSVRS